MIAERIVRSQHDGTYGNDGSAERQWQWSARATWASAVGGALVRAGYRVVTAGEGRSAPSRKLAAEAGIEDLGSLEAVVREAALVLSIVPPAAAPSFAASAVRAMRAAGTRPVFADCNAVAPATVQAHRADRLAERRPVRRRRHRRSRARPWAASARGSTSPARRARRSSSSVTPELELVDLGRRDRHGVGA